MIEYRALGSMRHSKLGWLGSTVLRSEAVSLKALTEILGFFRSSCIFSDAVVLYYY